MTEMPSYMIDNLRFEPCKPKKRYYYSSSMFCIILSIFTYILIFYVLELTPSSIFKDTKVLFFISNTLILIIAADYGAFTDKESRDSYGEYTAAAGAMRSPAVNYSPVPFLAYGENSRQQNSSTIEGIKNTKHDQTKNPNEEEPLVKDIVCVSHPERIVQVEREEKPRDDVATEKQFPVTDQIVGGGEACSARNHLKPKPYGRSKSDKPRRLKVTEDTKTKRKSYGRSESDSSKCMVVPEKWENVEEESEEFSKMSNEELNKRVEDFIQRFNRQIRLQSRTRCT